MAWLQETSGSIALRESLYAYTAVGTVHVIALFVFAGSVLAFDLRLTGLGFASLPASRLAGALRPAILFGFLVMVSSGSVLFYANPVRTYHSAWFRLKVLFLLLAALNALIFHRRLSRGLSSWQGPAPLPARLCGAVSILAWASVILCGRLIAHSWLDCDREIPALASWFAGCADGGGYP